MSTHIETVIWEAHTRWLNDPTVDVNPGVLILAAFKAARIAVVDLPEPCEVTPLDVAWWLAGDVTAVVNSGRVRVDLDDHRLSANEARELAAALLAAADAAEASR